MLERVDPTFVGRSAELGQLHALSGASARLVTIVGPPGVGKSRLARRAFETQGAALWIELCDLADGEALSSRLADALTWAAQAAGASPLVVLDNGEHLVEQLASQLVRWLDRSSSLRVWVTSRERLRLAGEHVLELAPLGLPPIDATALEQIASSEAGALFLARAAPVASARAAQLAELLHRLDGLPLAIELAAVRSSVLELEQLAERLERRFELLAVGARDAPARQATLRGAIDWSWSLLTASEQRVLAQCAVFRGTFSLAAAEAVLEAGQDEPRSILDLVQALVEKSLIQVVRVPGQRAARFRLYDCIRDFARDRLASSPARRDVEARHAVYFDRRGRHLSEGANEARGAGLVDRIAAEMDDLLAAFERGVTDVELASRAAARASEHLARFEHLLARQARTGAFSVLRRAAARVVARSEARGGDDLGLRAALACFWGCTCAAIGRFSVAQRLFDRAAEEATRSGDASARGAVACALGATMVCLTYDERRGALVEALALGRASADAALEASAHIHLGWLYLEKAQPDEALQHWELALPRVRALAWHGEEALLCGDRAAALVELGRWDAARRELAAAMAIYSRLGDERGHAGVTGTLGAVAHEQGALDEAEPLYRQAIERLGARGARRMEGLFWAYLGGLLAQRDKLTAAATALDTAAALARDVGDHVDVEIVACHRARLAVARAQHGSRNDGARANEVRAQAAALLEGPLPSSPDVRAARRLLARAIERAPYVVAEDGSWFCPPNARQVSLAKRQVLRRLLAALLAERTAVPVSAERLIAAGWPKEQISAAAAHNRLHVALTALRNLGLREVLLRVGEGYLIAPGVALEVKRAPRSA